MRRNWLASLLAIGGVVFTLWQWMKKRPIPVRLPGQIGQWINMAKVYQAVQQMSRMVRRRAGA